MKMSWIYLAWSLYAFLPACGNTEESIRTVTEEVIAQQLSDTSGRDNSSKSLAVVVPRDIKVSDYFPFMDSLIVSCDSILDYKLTEHLLVNANPWIIDTLVSFDYYERMEQGIFIYDQREMVVLRKRDTLWVPDSSAAAALERRFNHTLLDLNIPEFKLRIIEFDSVKYTFSVRVGRNEVKYLKTAGRQVSLRTPIGEGTIVRIERDPWFVDPVSGRPYSTTRRDDDRRTRMPRIPWMEPVIGGIRHGALIHPTTNPVTLGKAYSNGCVGTGEGDAWRIYYQAPIGTKVRFRYDLEITTGQGDTLRLEDIYRLYKNRNSI